MQSSEKSFISNTSSISDLNMARKVHNAMIPEIFPILEEIEIKSLYIPCNKVGGDLLDVIQISENTIAFLILDVAAFGVEAALISATAKIRFGSYIKAGFSPGTTVELVNADIRKLEANCFITAFLGYIDLHDNKLTYCNAGHPYPIVYRKSQNSLDILKTQGTFIGVLEDGFFEEHDVYVNPGDCLLLFSDGIYQMFQSDIVSKRKSLEQTVLDQLSKTSPEQFLSFVKNNSARPNGENIFDDDITFIVAEILTLSRKNQIKEKLGFSKDDPVYLQFIRYYEDMDKAIATVLTAMDNCGYTDDSIRKMKISLTELIVNAILHGNKKDFTKKVITGHIIDKNKSIISIIDEGEGFKPDMIPDPTLPENLVKDCGRGLFIVRHYVDNITFNDKGNRVTVVKYH